MHWLNRYRIPVLAAICLLWTGGILLVREFPIVPFLPAIWTGEQSFEDLTQREGRKTPTNPDMVFLGIDQSTLQFTPYDAEQLKDNRALQLMAERPFPWSREVWAILLDKLFASGARLVMFDLIFNPPNDGDAAFRAALDRHRDKVVLGANFDLSNVQEQGGAAQLVAPNASLIPPPQMEDDRVGYVVFFADPVDQKIRSVRYTITDLQLAGQAANPGESPYISFSGRALQKLGHAADLPRDLQGHRLRFSAIDAYAPKPLWELFDTKLWRANYGDGAFFKNKIVVVGSSAQVAHDVFATPMGPETPGPALHLHALAAALEHEFLQLTPLTVRYLLVIGAGVLAFLLITFIRRPLLCIVLLVVIAAAYLGVGRILYDRFGLLLLTVPVLSAFLLSGVFSLGFEYVLERIEKVRTRRTLERYVSKNLVKEILENPHGFYSTMRGARKPVTVLFSDLIGFTTLSELADPEELVRQLNEYLSGMVGIVFENDGTLDKFIGDAIMAVWGNVRSAGSADDAKACARTALGMRRALKKLNDGWRAEGRMGLGMGIGINQGEALVGNIGSYAPNERLDPTVIGDAVNLASRLEALTRTYAVDILVGPTASDLIRDDFHLRSVARVQVKGKSQPVEVTTLIGAKGDEIDPEWLKSLESYEEALRKFRERDFTNAKIILSRFLEFYPDDFLAKMYLDRALEYEQQPPDEAWNAVEKFTKK